ncbi:Hypp9532 [Branchiostoma lanceolatum]|uniref:Hypp9532 protein n=1 Tax=Branchiostoma lanceolatum TaxID=7740 RepID=A0A8S4MN64_BRALA|nr:Hypp9532 [Branchiostoma lanceolatum]
MDCVWTISAPEGIYIELEFTAFDVEAGGASCGKAFGCGHGTETWKAPFHRLLNKDTPYGNISMYTTIRAATSRYLTREIAESWDRERQASTTNPRSMDRTSLRSFKCIPASPTAFSRPALDLDVGFTFTVKAGSYELEASCSGNDAMFFPTSITFYCPFNFSETLEIIRRRLEKDRDLKNRTNLEVKDILELLTFIVTTTYFMFRDNIYQQKFGTAMGSPVSPVLANLFMEWLEEQAIATAPITCRPKLWKRYVDDVMEIVKRGVQQELTDHLNNTDPTGNIQFTYEEEQNGTLPFLDTLLVRKEDGTVKLLVYRKTTHTDQYLNFQSHHPLHQKLGVIRTLLDRCNAVVTEEQDKQLETQHVKRALSRCGYPQWTFKKVEQQRSRPKQKGKSKKQEEKARAMVVIPYIKGVTEPLERVFRKHNVSTAVRPKTTLRSLLVHPKDKLDDLVKTDCVYKIPCKSCNEVYIGETGRTFGTRLDEHKKEADSIEVVKYTRSQKRQAQQVDKKSAITDHIARHNCIIDWEGAKVIDREDNRRTRWIKEAVWIRKTAPVMNRDEGAYKLSRIWDSVLTAKAPPTSATYSGEKQHSSQKL